MLRVGDASSDAVFVVVSPGLYYTFASKFIDSEIDDLTSHFHRIKLIVGDRKI